MREQVEETLRVYVQETFLPQTPAAHLDVEDDLWETGAIDSVGLITLIAWMEDAFSFQLADEDLLPEHFRSIETIARLVSARAPASAVAGNPTTEGRNAD